MAHENRPNILVIMSDQHGAWASGAYGHPFVQTPAIDQIARSGVLFANAYCNSPICGPSRMSFMTGKLPHGIEAWDNGKSLAPDVPTWAHHLSAAGYQTVLAGKMHFIGPDQQHGFEERLGEELHSWRIKPSSYDELATRYENKNFFEAGPGTTRYSNYDLEMERLAVKYLEGEGRDPARPFALCVSFITPHFPLVAPQEFWNLYWPDNVDLPEIPEGYLDSLHPAWKALRRLYMAENLDAETIRRCRAAYFGLCTFMDERVAAVMNALGRSGLEDNTIVVYLSDHGEHLGRRGMWWKRSFFEESVRVPLMISWPGKFPAGQRVSQPVSLVDLSASLVEWGTGEPTARMDGHSLTGLAQGTQADWSHPVFSEYYGVDEYYGLPDSWLARQPRRMIRSGRYKLNYFSGASPELYDLEEDPGEWHNLAGDPAHADLITHLADAVTQGWSGERIAARLDLSRARRMLILRSEYVTIGPPRPHGR